MTKRLKEKPLNVKGLDVILVFKVCIEEVRVWI